MEGEYVAADLRVLAIASHVTYGYVGNKMATFVMQSMGCDVSAIHTVHFSNHTAYKQRTGQKVPAEEIQELYDGLKKSDLGPFDMMLTGYAASKEAVEVIGGIARDLRLKSNMKPGSFFWILDPVMGDQGRLYVAEDIVPVYRSLIREADLILPNCFEAETLAESKITDLASLAAAITKLHKEFKVPHIVITSVPFLVGSKSSAGESGEEVLAVVGSSAKSDMSPRMFSVTTPALPVVFSGTGDMFAGLMLARLREAVSKTDGGDLLNQRSWLPADEVTATALPLARATEKVLASMHVVLSKTVEARAEALEAAKPLQGGKDTESKGGDGNDKDSLRAHLRQMKASEVRVVKHAKELRAPDLSQVSTGEGQGLRAFTAEAVSVSPSLR